MNFFWRNLLWLLAGIAAIVLVATAVNVANSLPPREFTILTGREGGAFYAFAQEYQAIAKEFGFELQIQTTAGSLETLDMLEAGKAQVGFVQGGIGLTGDATRLSTLASLFYEPVWIFYRDTVEGDVPLEALPELTGLRVGIGEVGSGNNMLARQLLNETGVSSVNTTLVELPGQEMAEALRRGELDAAVIVLAADSPLIQELIRDPALELMSLRRADAFARRHRFLSVLTLPEGTIDLLQNQPPRDIELLATVANLVVSNDLHPDLLRLLTIAAVRTHQRGGFFEPSYAFPNVQYADLPVGNEELAYLNRIRNGESDFDNYLPFWAAALVDRYLLFVVPIALLLLPYFSRGPLLYTYLMRKQINKWYRTMRDVELRVDTMHVQDIDDAIDALDALDLRLARELRVSDNYMPDVYTLRSHIRTVITRLEWRKAHGETGDKGTGGTGGTGEQGELSTVNSQ